MENSSGKDKESDLSEGQKPHNWQQTIDETAGKNSKPLNETTSPGMLNASGMPFPELLLNRQIGTGKIVGYIGSGGMGDVYKTWSEDLNRFHAVKLLKRGSNIQAEKRFEREIKVTATFDHPNIVHVHNAGRWKSYLFLEMEFIDGYALDAHLKQMGPFPPVVCIAIGIMMTSALQYAHNHQYTLDGKTSSGVIHRDLKPSNIMLAKNGRLKLMDFGIAKPIGAEFTSLTMGIVGSLIYLPPEQIDTSTSDHRSDIYTLGEVLYEIFTGKSPFVFESQREFLNSKTKGNYPPISSFTENVPQTLIDFIDKCMKVDPDKRFQTASDAGDALKAIYARLTNRTPEEVLESFAAGEKIEQTQTQISSPSRKRTPLIAAILGVVTIVSLLTVFLIFFTGKRNTISTTETNNNNTGITNPVVISPNINDTLTSDTVTFVWKSIPSAEKYLVHISSTNSFFDTIYHAELTDTMCTAVNFKEDLHYFWRIGVSDQHKQILWSSTRYFTKTESQPAIPNLIAPVNNQNFSHQEVTFQWQKVPFAKTYHVQIASDSTFRHIEIDSSGNRDTSISLKRFKAATTYYWRVKTEKRTITGDWSKPFSFTIHTAVDSGNFPDYVIEAVFALKNKNCTEAELAINKLQSSDPRKDTLVMRLIEKYLAEGNKTKAMRCFKSITSVDMFSELLKGRLLIDDKNYTDAFEVLDAALHLKTRFKKSLVSADVTYYRAIAANNNYNSYKSEKWKQTALEAWHQVYTIYKDNHNHPRYIEASRESSRIAE